MDLATFNELDDRDAAAVLSACCGSEVWVNRMLAARPYRDPTELLTTTEQVWWDLGAHDWQQAFSTQRAEHTRAEYEARFGYPYVVHATGRTPEELASIYETRLGSDPLTELTTSAAEQARVTNRLLRIALDLG